MARKTQRQKDQETLQEHLERLLKIARLANRNHPVLGPTYDKWGPIFKDRIPSLLIQLQNFDDLGPRRQDEWFKSLRYLDHLTTTYLGVPAEPNLRLVEDD